MRKIIHEKSQQVVDSITGELISETAEKTYVIKKETEPFFLTYSKQMSLLYNITSLAAIKILWKFLELAQYNTGIVLLTPLFRKKIISELDISESIFNKSIKMLTELKIISGSRGTYQINPEIHWKGSSNTREKLLKSGCRITIQPE